MIPKIRFAVGLFIILIQLFMYVNADYIYGPYAEMVRTVMTVYFMLLGVLSFYTLKVVAQIGPQDLPGFTFGFILTALVVLALPIAQIAEVESIQLALGFGFLHAFVKAFNEEIIFRGALPAIMGKSIYADVISSIFFGIFHLAVTGASLIAMVFLMILGFIWAMVRNRFGLMGSTGSHFAYNLAALGVLPQLL